MRRRSFKYRLYPNADQTRELDIMLETHRRLYNDCLGQLNVAYGAYKLAIRYEDQSAWFKNERRHNPWFARLNFSSAQATMRRVHGSLANFFRRIKVGAGKPGYPKFKARERFHSVEFPTHGDGIRLLADGHLRVQHVGQVKVKLHRPVRGTIKTARLVREGTKWYAVFSCELEDVLFIGNDRPAVGLDVGLLHFLATSDGKFEPNPRYLKEALPALRRAQRAFSRKKKGGMNRRKAAHRVAVLHARVANQRRDHHHKVALKLVRRYGLIAVEGLSVLGMLKNRRLSRAIQDAGWSQFLGITAYKAEDAGGREVEVNCRGTSQECSGCGERVEKELSERVHRCPSCGLVLDRDTNAARNVLARGLRLLARTGPASANGPLVGSVA